MGPRHRYPFQLLHHPPEPFRNPAADYVAFFGVLFAEDLRPFFQDRQQLAVAGVGGVGGVFLPSAQALGDGAGQSFKPGAVEGADGHGIRVASLQHIEE